MQIELEKRHKPRRFRFGYGVTVPAVLILAVYLFLVLSANSGVGTRFVVRMADAALPGSLEVEDLAVQPSLTRVLARHLILRDPEGREVISAENFQCDIRIVPLILNRVHMENCRVAGGRVLVQEQRDGRLGIAAAFTKLDRNKAPRFEQTPLRFDNVDLYNVDVLVNLDDLALLFKDTHAIAADILVANDGFDMFAERILSQGGRIFLSERILGFGPGPSNKESLAWEVLRMQQPWKTMETPYPHTLDPRNGGLDIPIDHFDVRNVDWQREEVRMRAASLHAGDIKALVHGWIQFLPETPTLPKKDRGVVSFDGLAKLEFTADSPFLDFILPQTIRSAVRERSEQTLQPLVLQTYGNIDFAEGAIQASLRDLNILGWSLTRFDGRISLHDGQLRLHPGASAYFWDGLVSGDANFEPKTGLWDARLCLDDIDFEALARPLRRIIAGEVPDWMQARISTRPARCTSPTNAGLVLHGDLTSKAGFRRDPARMLPADRPLQDPMIVAEHAAVHIAWKHGIKNTPLRSATIEAAGYLDQRGVFHIDGARGVNMRGAGADLRLSGDFDSMDSTLKGVTADINIQNIGPWMHAAGVQHPPEKGTLKAKIDLDGTVGDPEAQRADIRIDMPPDNLQYPEFKSRIVLEQHRDAHRIRDFSFDSPIGELQASGTIRAFENRSLMRPRAVPNVDVNLHADMLDLGLIPMETDADGRLVTGDFHIQGPVSNPFINGTFLFDNVRVAGEAFDIVQGKLRHHGDDLELEELELIRGKGRTRGHVRYNTRTQWVDLRAAGQRMRLRDFTAFRDAKDLGGVLRFDVDAQGNLDDLQLHGSTIVDELRIKGRDLGSAVLAWDTDENIIHGTGLVGRDIHVSITAPSSLESAHVESWFRNFPITDYLPELKEAFDGSQVTGEMLADIRIGRSGRALQLEAIDAVLPLDDLQLLVGDRTLALREPDCRSTDASCPRPQFTLRAHTQDGSLQPEVTLSNIEIGADGHYVSIDGAVDPQRVNMRAHGDLDLALLRLIPDLIVDAEGIAHLNIEAAGPVNDPTIGGYIGIQDALIAPRDLGTSLIIDHVLMEVQNDRIVIAPDAEHALRGTLFNGDLRLYGAIGLDGLIPKSLDLMIATTGLAYRIPDALNIILNTDLQLTVQDISDDQSWAVAGDVEIVEGRYYRDVNLLSDNFSIGGIGRSIDVFTQPIWQTNPIIRNLQTNLNISGRDRLKLVNSIANAELHLEFKTDLKLTGPLGNMHLTGEMTLLDKSRVYYGDRRFDVSDGALLFDGFIDDQGIPWPFIDTRLETEFKSRCASRRRGTLDATQTRSTLVRTIDETPTIYMNVEVQGRLPLDINYNMESQPSYDQRDQISLIVTGCSVDELMAGNGSAPGLELLFRPVISLVERNVEERFNIDDVDLIPTPGGNADILVEDEVSDRLTWTLDATIGSGEATRQALSGRLTIRNGLQLELLQQSNTTNPFSVSGGLRFRWRLE